MTSQSSSRPSIFSLIFSRVLADFWSCSTPTFWKRSALSSSLLGWPSGRGKPYKAKWQLNQICLFKNCTQSFNPIKLDLSYLVLVPCAIQLTSNSSSSINAQFLVDLLNIASTAVYFEYSLNIKFLGALSPSVILS